jgi:Enhancer of polycomb-like
MGNTNQAKTPKIVIQPSHDSIPVEEKPLEVLFPDLNVANLMQVEKIDSSNHSHLHKEYLNNPLPVLKVELSKEPLIPSFSLLENVKKSKLVKESKPFSTYTGIFGFDLEPGEDELAERVEYDMDEVDRNWLASFNLKQKKMGDKECSFDLFEFIIDQLEKLWFDLVKDIPKGVQEDRYPEETTCAVCDGNIFILL